MGWLTALLRSLPFANGTMLLWGLAAAVPILIHLWSKRRYDRVTWAAMSFLLAAARKNSRRIRVEQLLLLLIRVAILLLLALALADPVMSLLPSLGSSLGSGSTHHVLVLDGSYSMAYQAGERSRFEIARQLATQVVSESRQGDGFTLILMAEPPQTVIADPAFAPHDVIEELENLQVRHAGANLRLTLDAIESILRQAADKHTRLAESKAYFFTDLGRTTWDEAASQDSRRRLGRLGERATLLLVDVGQSDVQNLAVTNLQVREPLAAVGHRVRLEAEIENFGSREATGRQALLLVDDQQVHAERLTVPAGGRATVAFEHRFDTPGEHRVEVRLEDDPLPVDNHRWASVPVQPAIRVLCVEGRPGEAQHVALALEPGIVSPARIQPEVRLENALLDVDLQQYDAIFLCNLARFGHDEASVLYDYLQSGGGLIITLGDQVQPENYNQVLGGEQTGRRVLPGRLEGIGNEAQYAFDPLDYQHPIVAPFAGHQRAGLLTTPIWRYHRVQLYDPLAARVALAFHNGDPAIVEERILAGTSILLTTATSPQAIDRSTSPPTPWSALATWPSFPPLIQEMLARAVQGRAEARNVRVGQSLEGSVRGTHEDLSVSIDRPDGGSERVATGVEGVHTRWAYSDVNLSGIYTAQYGSPVNRQELYAANVDPRESDLQRTDIDSLPSQLNPGLQLDEAAGLLPTAQPAQFYRHLLGLLLALLLLESTLAWYFGNASA